MRRYRGIIIFWTVFMLWAGVTVYFYFQHRVAVKTLPVKLQVSTNDTRLVVKEFTLRNYSREMPESGYRDFTGPWYAKAVSCLPSHLQLPVYKICSLICSFYSSPFTFDQEIGVLKVRGMVICSSVEGARELFEMPHDRYQLLVEGSASNSRRGRIEDESNIIYFEEEFKDFPLDLKSFRFGFGDGAGKMLKEFTVKPEWRIKTCNFWNLRQGDDSPGSVEIGPQESVLRFVSLLREGKRDRAAKYILPECLDRFPWSYLEHDCWKGSFGDFSTAFEGDYFGFHDVFSCSLGFFPALGEPVQARQKFYCLDSGGRWWIITASPLEPVGNNC
jgi:hypothetical protein